MAVADRVKEAVARVTAGEEGEIPASIDARIQRGVGAMREDAAARNECLRFVRGRQYTWVDRMGAIREQGTTADYERQGGKARHRIRRIRNYIFDYVEKEVADASQKVPGYDIAPTSNEASRISAARLARKVLYYGYDKWKVRRATQRVIRLAVAVGEGFAWPYFDNTVGPYFKVDVLDEEGGPTGETRTVGRGEIKIRTFGPNEVFWEPGLRFEESPWIGIRQARDMDAVMEMDGYVGGTLKADAHTSEASDDASIQERLVLVTDYLERPTRSHPSGRWLTMANERVIVPMRPYPCRNAEGKVLDEPVLHQLYYSEDADADRNLGLVRFLIDPQSQLNHAVSKIAEWVNLALNPQLLVINGKVLSGKLNDMPGAIVRVAGGGEVKWRDVPKVPTELFKQKEEAIADMSKIAAQNDVPSQVESGKGIRYLLERDASRRAAFYNNLADFHADLGRHLLYLVQRHYTEPRLLKIRGPQGIEPIADFIGAELLGEDDVRVEVGSLESLTREAIEEKILGFAERGWIAPHKAMAAINAGTAEGLVQSYEKDIARANLIIQKVSEGADVLFSTPPRRPFAGEDPGLDPETGLEREWVEGWMPRPFDNVQIQKDEVADFMKGTAYDDFEAEQQEALNMVYDAYLQIEAEQQAREAAAQKETAEGQGMANAARPSAPPPLPDQAPLNRSE